MPVEAPACARTDSKKLPQAMRKRPAQGKVGGAAASRKKTKRQGKAPRGASSEQGASTQPAKRSRVGQRQPSESQYSTVNKRRCVTHPDTACTFVGASLPRVAQRYSKCVLRKVGARGRLRLTMVHAVAHFAGRVAVTPERAAEPWLCQLLRPHQPPWTQRRSVWRHRFTRTRTRKCWQSSRAARGMFPSAQSCNSSASMPSRNYVQDA